MCDFDEFNRRLAHFGQDASNFSVDVVGVRPGVYGFCHDDDAQASDGPKERVYTRFQWVRDAEPAKDLLGSYVAVDVNAHAFVQAQAKRWPTLYGRVKRTPGCRERSVPWAEMSANEQRKSWHRVANHIFCVVGGGIDWHEKGFPLAKVDLSVPDVDPPQLREQFGWYPFSERYGGLFEVPRFAPSFAKLAFRVLESIISFGIHVSDNDRVKSTRERMLLAVKRYRELSTQHPGLADQEYVAWLGQEGRAETWVANFDLGSDEERDAQKAKRAASFKQALAKMAPSAT